VGPRAGVETVMSKRKILTPAENQTLIIQPVATLLIDLSWLV